jgi:hypothetical protein
MAQLTALGAEYVVIHGPLSQEHYRDFRNPDKLEGLAPVAFEFGDDRVYRIPFRSLAFAVRPDELPQHPPIHGYLEFLEPFTRAAADGARPTLYGEWQGASEYAIRGAVAEGTWISVQVNWDRGWTATQDGRPIETADSPWGFIVLKPRAAAETEIVLKYHGTAEQRAGAAVSLSTLLLSLAGLWRQRRRRRDLMMKSDERAASGELGKQTA